MHLSHVSGFQIAQELLTLPSVMMRLRERAENPLLQF